MITSLPPHLPRKNSLHLLEFMWRGGRKQIGCATKEADHFILLFFWVDTLVAADGEGSNCKDVASSLGPR